MWNDIKVIQSKETTVKKLVFTKPDAVVESVLYKYPDYETRTVICCSSQSGCPVGCRFCGTGDYFVRSLTGSEIVEQVDTCIGESQTNPDKMQKLQIMFMSMGEPLLNKNGMIDALRTLHGCYPNARLLISTSAPKIDYRWVRKISVEIPAVGLQFSVHESTDERRNNLIPFKQKLTLREIANEGSAWWSETGRKPFFNYCASDENSTEADADRLRQLFDPRIFEATISVICERNDGLPARNEHQQNLAIEFSNKLLARGFNTRVFDPAGQDDIGGGCGQLWYVQDWMKLNPSLAKPSVGFGKAEVHVPGNELKIA
jgi:23S rRNA (adenine2503-C2)-methyltransferase